MLQILGYRRPSSQAIRPTTAEAHVVPSTSRHPRSWRAFGLTKKVTPTGTNNHQSHHIPPQHHRDEKLMVFFSASFGIVLWEIYTRKSPFFLGEVSFEELVEAVCWENKRPTIPDDCPGSLKALIKTCWDGNPAKRPSFEKIIQMLDEIIAEVAKQESVQQQQIPSPRK